MVNSTFYSVGDAVHVDFSAYIPVNSTWWLWSNAYVEFSACDPGDARKSAVLRRSGQRSGARRVSAGIPKHVIASGASPDFFRDTAARIAQHLPNGKYTVLEGQDHGAPADVVGPVVAEFLER